MAEESAKSTTKGSIRKLLFHSSPSLKTCYSHLFPQIISPHTSRQWAIKNINVIFLMKEKILNRLKTEILNAAECLTSRPSLCLFSALVELLEHRRIVTDWFLYWCVYSVFLSHEKLDCLQSITCFRELNSIMLLSFPRHTIPDFSDLHNCFCLPFNGSEINYNFY